MSINQLNALFRYFMQFYVYFLIFALSKINYARTLLSSNRENLQNKPTNLTS
ncbi:hypothetical protein MICAD_2610003 [Microcystis aeruginosa PCC 7941]|nr:hypothetical protein MICAD_2610003 [Microcystis aeruginosa PCC 7941]